MARKHNPDQSAGFNGTPDANPTGPHMHQQPHGHWEGKTWIQHGKPKSRTRKVLKWTGIGAATLFVAGALATNGGTEAPPEVPPAVEQTTEPQPPEESQQDPLDVPTDDPSAIPGPTTVPVPVEPTTPEVDPDVARDDLFVDYVRDNTTTLATVPDATIVEFAQSVCAAYDRGATPEDVVGVILQHSSTEAQVTDYAVVAGAGVAAYCPEYGDMVVDAAEAN